MLTSLSPSKTTIPGPFYDCFGLKRKDVCRPSGSIVNVIAAIERPSIYGTHQEPSLGTKTTVAAAIFGRKKQRAPAIARTQCKAKMEVTGDE